jgi:hypothetical protein
MRSWTRLASLVPLLALALVCGACDSGGSSSSALDCSLSTDPLVEGFSLTVTYRAEVEGDGSFSSVTYTTPDGVETVESPSLPWEAQVLFPADQDGQTAEIRVEGQATVESGRAGVGYLGEGNDGGFSVELSEEDECSTQ